LTNELVDETTWDCKLINYQVPPVLALAQPGPAVGADWPHRPT